MTSKQNQGGFALLLFMIVVIGFAILGTSSLLTSTIDQKTDQRRMKTQKVLQEAKEALLMFTYNYPQFNLEGPGRLPCPDVNNNGLSGALTLPLCQSVGRFPWNDPNLNFYDARDADNERLWYAVSDNFYNLGGGPIINSGSSGTITIFDQTGAMLYDGTVSGIAAVIIAPGSAINGQDRSIANGDDPFDDDPDDDPGIITASNYLDSFNGFDNSSFVNGSNINSDGFILGPVYDAAQNFITVNDQMVIITAEEIVAMAEKATLQAYRDALNDYVNRPGFGRYPWLDPYDSSDGLTTFDAEVTSAAPAPVIGRLPSIFSSYFTADGVVSAAIKTDLNFVMNIDGFPVQGSVPASVLPDVFFNAAGDLSTSFDNGFSFKSYAWDGRTGMADPNSPNDGVWELCSGNISSITGVQEDDCNRKTDGTFKTASDSNLTQSDVWLKVREITVTFIDGGSPFEIPLANRTAAPLVYVPPDGANHAFVTSQYNNSPAFFSVTYEQDNVFMSNFSLQSSGTMIFNGGDTFSVSMFYYPELPNWSLTNGWHDNLQLAYSSAVQPGGDGICSTGVDDCLTLLNSPGIVNDKLALLILSGIDNDGDADVGLVDNGGGPQFFSDDLNDIFEGENNTLDLTFDQRPVTGNDIVLLLE